MGEKPIILSEEGLQKINQIQERYKTLMLGVARQALGFDMSGMAEDVVQEVYFKIVTKYLDKIGDVDGHEAKGYILSMVKTTALDFIKKEKLRCYEELQEGSSYDKTDPFEAVIFRSDLKDAINSLSKGERDVFNLYTVEGYSHAEISELLGINEGASKVNLSRAQKKLREKLSDYDPRHKADPKHKPDSDDKHKPDHAPEHEAGCESEPESELGSDQK